MTEQEIKAYDKGYFTGQNQTVEDMCQCYCDDICTRGMSGMCWFKHDNKGQVKNDFKYDGCNELKLLRASVKL